MRGQTQRGQRPSPAPSPPGSPVEVVGQGRGQQGRAEPGEEAGGGAGQHLALCPRGFSESRGAAWWTSRRQPPARRIGRQFKDRD